MIGTRPEAIKLSPVVRALDAPLVFVTGQHREMLEPILQDLGIVPDENLDVMRADQPLADLAAEVLRGMRRLIVKHRPRRLIVQGDTTSAAMSALAAFYERVPVAHVEAGLRTHRRDDPFPEEVNRSLIARVADLHFAPTPLARENLTKEGIDPATVHVVGNTVIDALIHARDELVPRLAPDPLDALPRPGRQLVLVTLHRRESFGADLAATVEGVARLARAFPDAVDLLFPVHRNPNVRAVVEQRLANIPNLRLVEPLGYVRFVSLMLRARLIVTDSGGIQEEASFLGVPVLVTRRATERPEAIEAAVAQKTDADAEVLFDAAAELLGNEAAHRARAVPTTAFGDGTAAAKIADRLRRSEP
ncbi:MAG: UDP-N-acetylglucosamine 2-epimerase (non-hydrolyzing) [Myxococcota bacterium]